MDRRVGTYDVSVVVEIPGEDDVLEVDVYGRVEVEDYGIGRHEYGWDSRLRSEVVKVWWDRRGWNPGDAELVDEYIEENYDDVCDELIRDVEKEWA